MPSDPTSLPPGFDAAATLLEWYAAMGVDVTLADAPLDRFEESAKVRAAAFLPPKRSTLVAPGLREPALRGSGNPIARQTIIAVETEPAR